MNDGANLFDAAHGNLSGTRRGAAARVTLSAARLAMRKQTGPGGGLITVTPRFLLAPPEMETAVEKLLTQVQAVTTDETNPFARLSLIVEPRLERCKTLVCCRRADRGRRSRIRLPAGAPGPQVESRAGFEVDGVQFKVRLDYGAGFTDWRGWYSNAGQ